MVVNRENGRKKLPLSTIKPQKQRKDWNCNANTAHIEQYVSVHTIDGSVLLKGFGPYYGRNHGPYYGQYYGTADWTMRFGPYPMDRGYCIVYTLKIQCRIIKKIVGRGDD